jgi:hypothetical protein
MLFPNLRLSGPVDSRAESKRQSLRRGFLIKPNYGRPLLPVPEGQPTIARQFTAGTKQPNTTSPEGTAENSRIQPAAIPHAKRKRQPPSPVRETHDKLTLKYAIVRD